MPTPLRILIVEDSQDDADLMVDELRRAGIELQWKRVETERDFLAEIKELPDIVLSDFAMPRFSGLRAAKLLRESGLNIPFILISGTVGEEIAVQAMREGATDYLLKDRIARLGNCVQRALEEKRLRQQQQQAEEELRGMHETLHEMVTHSPAIIYKLKIEGQVLTPAFVSENMERLFGFTAAETMSYEWWFGNLHPEDQARAVAGLQKSIAGEGNVVDYRIRRKDGAYRWVQDSSRAVRNASGQAKELIGVWTDITERKEAEIVMRESERRLQEMLENAQMIAMTLDQHGKVTFCNEHLLRLTGWTREEVVGNDWFARFIPETETHVRRLFFENVEAGTVPSHYENAILTKDGRLRDIFWNNTMLRDVDGKFIGTASLGEDVTDRRQAEEALRESEEKFRQLAENINEVFWITDPAKHRMLYVSPAYEEIWGRSCESAYQSAKTWLEAIHPDDRERVSEAARTKQELGLYDETYRIIRPDGSMRWIQDRAYPVHNFAGQVYRIVGTAEDITQRKETEQQLRQAQKMESIGLLAGGVAHDFNNILLIIQINLELVLMVEAKLLPETKDHLAEIGKAADRAGNLNRQLLAFSRREAMQMQLLDLNDLSTSFSKMLRRIVGEHIRVQNDLAAATPAVHGDPGMIEQVLMNLAVNARDAMPNGGQLIIGTELVTVDAAEAKLNPRKHAGQFACLSVRDTGTGIAPENMSRIFEPFFTTKGVGKGTGLGLATVFGIAEQHKGWVEVASTVGVGTTFRVFFPLSQETLAAASGVVLRKVRGGAEKILLVEDERGVRDVLFHTLANFGYAVVEADSGISAQKTWREHGGEFDLVVTDMVMPGGLTGLELINLLRAEKPRLKALLMSGYSAELARGELPVAADVIFLHKPFPTRVLAETVRKCLDAG